MFIILNITLENTCMLCVYLYLGKTFYLDFLKGYDRQLLLNILLHLDKQIYILSCLNAPRNLMCMLLSCVLWVMIQIIYSLKCAQFPYILF